eukprot:CAMPEP_0185761748 /NCGR_PEP_ID=MMETSP1174-20130828/20682_1 /TAXON_ID=35687 /ORGANISM="Dictyocha speculum, Strain CCMP1381" /LENGTH=504 /DNA_ID=CAMNT_0028443111 /DNA_START=413 /DNA_END=1927 /DNA_ORIENTATION=-
MDETSQRLIGWVVPPPNVIQELDLLKENNRNCVESAAVLYHERFSLVLRTHCERVLPQHAVPHAMLIMPHGLPLSSTGKVSRQGLPRIDFSKPQPERWFRSNPPHAIHTNTEVLQHDKPAGGRDDDLMVGCEEVIHVVQRAWAQVLGVPIASIKPEVDSFRDMGGDSLSALQVVRRLIRLAGQQKSHEANMPVSDEALGGDLGELRGTGFFSPIRLLKAPSLRAYALELAEPLERYVYGQSEDKNSMTASAGQERFFGTAVEWDDLFPLELTSSTMIKHEVEDTRLDGVLVRAAARGEVSVVKVLVDGLGCNPDGRAGWPTGPLHTAAANGRASVAAVLISAGASVRKGNEIWQLPAHLAAQTSPAILLDLLQAGTPLYTRDKRKQTLLHHASRTGCVECMRIVIDAWDKTKCNGKDRAVDWRDRWHRTALHWAVLNGHLNAVELIVRAGATVGVSMRQNAHRKSTHLRYETPLEIAERCFPPAGGLFGDLLRERLVAEEKGKL